MEKVNAFDGGARALIAKIKAHQVIQCADTGDMVASRVDRKNTFQGWKNEVLYWYVPANASDVSDLVKIEIQDLASGFFCNPIHPFTWEKIVPVKPQNK